MGVSSAPATYLVKSGWLQRLFKGAYLLKGDSPSHDGIIAYLSRRVPGLHVGGKTALDWQGVRHNIAFRAKVVLWAQKPYEIPSWVEPYSMPAALTTAPVSAIRQLCIVSLLPEVLPLFKGAARYSHHETDAFNRRVGAGVDRHG
ncbi:hypothetical protein NH14_028715 [Paraburkholderia sacchari]|uniref:Transcriptional regulator AbiEi antitoxin N-terminal domain-containing protein n=1 Tax=Paraburkholderia sacchari TaxID=159450 RepID=A0A8T6ZK26_9BURK|nr:hypothetical protein [Paraburkholderia sacchari]